jgi:hypothetical protein
MVDAAGRVWFLVDKVPVFDVKVTAESVFPLPVAVRCAVVQVVPDAGG